MENIVWILFFFQAEDGIRDTSVTGVQTCALPIFGRASATRSSPSKGGRFRSLLAVAWLGSMEARQAAAYFLSMSCGTGMLEKSGSPMKSVRSKKARRKASAVRWIVSAERLPVLERSKPSRMLRISIRVVPPEDGGG